jgi:DNA-binding GntR family transcriptional regulator
MADPTPLPDRVLAERTLADRAYHRLRKDIVAGRLPAGGKLKLETLVAGYGVGMSPLRDALARLVGDGLAASEGQRGFWVPPLSLAEFDDITRVRRLVESEALALSIQQGDARWELGVRAAFAALDEAERALPGRAEALSVEIAAQWEGCNRAFHAALVAACGSPLLIQLQDRLYLQSERYRWVSLKTSRGDRPVDEEHRAIFDAAIARNPLRAVRMIESHLAQTAGEVRQALESRPVPSRRNQP